MKISVIIPAFNECHTIEEIIQRVLSTGIIHDIVVVDDGSTDGTRQLLEGFETHENIQVYYHDRNLGKGAAVRTGLQNATGEVIIIQDADLEYDPGDYQALIEPIRTGSASIVYGSRFMDNRNDGRFTVHTIANKIVTRLTNILFNCNLTDVETGYKIFRLDLIEEMDLQAQGFNFDPEITIKFIQRGLKIIEKPIRYTPRSYKDGKKIGFADAIEAVWTLFKFRIKSRRNQTKREKTGMRRRSIDV